MKLAINVEIFVEEKYTNNREKAVAGNFHFTAIDVNNNPIKLIDDIDIVLESNHQ